MRRLATRWAQFKHRCLCRVSKLYRAHNTVVDERERWRREACEQTIRVESHLRTIADLRDQLATARSQADKSSMAYEQALRDLQTERSLRQSADARADQFHRDCLESYKAHADWMAAGLTRRPIFTKPALDADKPDHKSINPKPTARSIARQIENEMLAKLYDDIQVEAIQAESEQRP